MFRDNSVKNYFLLIVFDEWILGLTNPYCVKFIAKNAYENVFHFLPGFPFICSTQAPIKLSLISWDGGTFLPTSINFNLSMESYHMLGKLWDEISYS